MADAATLDAPAAVTPPTPAATPSAPVGIPDPPAKLTVPASALGLETTLDTPKPATPAAAAKPAELSAPAAAQKPNEPAKGAAPTATSAATPAKPATPAAPEKIKIGDKEYTVAELEKLVAKPAPAPAPKAEPAPKPIAPAAPAPTPEQIAAQKAETAKLEQTWVDNFVQKEAINFPMSEDEMETLLSGGKTAVELFGNKLAQVAARSALLARKSMYEDLEPMIANLDRTLAPLLTNHQDIARVAAETQFTSAYPEFKPHMDMVREFATGLERQFPQQVAAMTQQQFAQEVAAQVDAQLQAEYKRWNPAATDTWKEFAAKQAQAAAAAPVATPVAAAAAPAAPAKPKIQPPAANVPAAIPVTSSPDFHKSVAKDLQD